MTGMVRTLQKRFVTAAMAAVTVLLLVLVGAINGLNMVSVRSEEERMLEMLLDNRGIPGDLPSGGRDRRGGKDHPYGGRGLLRVGPFTMDNAMSMRFFLVQFEEDGSIGKVDTSHIWSVTSDQAAGMAEEIRDAGSSRGRTGNFRYRMEEDTAVFLDVSESENAVLSVLLISGLIAAVCWLLTAILIVVLSRRAILPVAENIRRQREFVTNAGHEIKTPLAIISANAEALELFNGENKWTRNIRTQVVRLNGLMEELLTLARMDETVSVNKEEIDLTALAAEAAEQFGESAQAGGISLRIPSAASPVLVSADRKLIRQLVNTLMDNAVKYTPEGGTICLETAYDDGKAVLRQWNHIVPGTEEKDPSRLLDRFYRGDRARTQKNGGYGIGLSAARSIAEANGAVLSVSYPNVRKKEQNQDDHRILFTLHF